jgi:ribosomal protein L31
MEEGNNQLDHGGEIFSKAIKAGKRTYYVDVRSTKNKDMYITICESKKIFFEGHDKPVFDKRKIHIYKEDFDKISEALNEAINHVKVNHPEIFNFDIRYRNHQNTEGAGSATDPSV